MKTYTEKAIELSKTLAEKLTHAELELLVDMMGDDDLDMMLYHELRLTLVRRRPTPPAPKPESEKPEKPETD